MLYLCWKRVIFNALGEKHHLLPSVTQTYSVVTCDSRARVTMRRCSLSLSALHRLQMDPKLHCLAARAAQQALNTMLMYNQAIVHFAFAFGFGSSWIQLIVEVLNLSSQSKHPRSGPATFQRVSQLIIIII